MVGKREAVASGIYMVGKREAVDHVHPQGEALIPLLPQQQYLRPFQFLCRLIAAQTYTTNSNSHHLSSSSQDTIHKILYTHQLLKQVTRESSDPQLVPTTISPS